MRISQAGDEEENMSSRGTQAFRLGLSLLIVLAVAGIGLWLLEAPSAATRLLRVTFIDVGQGEAAWLSTPDGWDILIDGSRKKHGPGLVAYLQGQGVTDIEVLILTHPHPDHVGGLVTVLENMEVDQALTNCQAYSSGIYRTFEDLLDDHGIPTTCVRDGDTFAWGTQVSATVVNPREPLMSGAQSDTNNNSVVLRISYYSIDFLFTADVRSEAEAAILDRGPTLEAEILKVAHHGSNSSSTEAFLTEVGPEVAVVSVGASNPYGHPANQALERVSAAGAATYRTDLHGTILVETNGSTYRVEPERHLEICLPFTGCEF